jgi:transposase-like protein
MFANTSKNNQQTFKTVGTRETRGKLIAEKARHSAGQIIKVDDNTYKVRSQNNTVVYTVKSTEIGWKCSCLDHVTKGAKCKHIWAIEFRYTIKKEVKVKTISPVNITSCIFCNSSNIEKDGIRHNKHGDIQKFHCIDCNRYFSYNIGFEKMKHNPQAVTTAMQLYFSGESLRNTKNSLKLLGVHVSHQTVLNWIEKYTNLMKQYVDKLKPQVGDTWRADEVFVKFSGNMKYLFALMDDETRYWIAQEVAHSKDKHDAKNLGSVRK